MMMSKRTITKQDPVTTDEVKMFADSLNLGDKITSRLPFKVWTSTSNFTIKHKTVTARIIAKYPYLVGTDYGVFTWNELLFGYYEGSTLLDEVDTDVAAVTAVPKAKKSKTSKKAA